jgi:hypothetical protein
MFLSPTQGVFSGFAFVWFDQSDHDPDFDSSKHPESADIHDTPTYESSSEDEQPDTEATDTATVQTQEESTSSMTD